MRKLFNRLLEEGKIVKRGLKPDAKVFDELIFDVNTAYFENNGGYEYAKKFFEEAYRLAVKEIGGENFILSAVLHADGRNRALSEELGRDVFHYHMHVVYVHVVQKEIKWSKRTKDKSLIGKVKEVIPQISHSKKWPMRVPVERDGKTIMLNSYSLLQDRFFEHMKAADFDGFERGERGSIREHLTDLEYKTMKESERLSQKQKESAALDEANAEKEKSTTALSAKIQEQEITAAENEKRLAAQEKKINAIKGKVLTVKQIEKIPVKISRPLLGGSDGDTASISKNDWDNVKKTALTQAQTDEQFQTAVSENITLKKEMAQGRGHLYRKNRGT